MTDMSLVRSALLDARDFIQEVSKVAGNSQKLVDLHRELEAALKVLKPRTSSVEPRPPIYPADWIEPEEETTA